MEATKFLRRLNMKKNWRSNPPTAGTHAATGYSPYQPATVARKGDTTIPSELSVLGQVLRVKRAGQTKEEDEFVNNWLIPKLPKNAWKDEFGNVHTSIGVANNVLFSCHTDTVHSQGGTQQVLFDDIRKELFTPASNCLGADDGAGLWLMLAMIEAERPGHYLFHRLEEQGGQGSAWMRSKKRNLLQAFKYAIAFDRRGDTDIITHQGGRRTASDDFAEAFAELLGKAQAGLKYKPSANGSFTDTANYADVIPECTNISVGYHSAHSSSEYQDTEHLLTLRKALLEVDFKQLPKPARDPAKSDQRKTYIYGGGYYDEPAETAINKSPAAKPVVTVPATLAPKKSLPTVKLDMSFDEDEPLERAFLVHIVEKWPSVAADMLENAGVTLRDLDEAFEAYYSS
jgi:hypothetical protein